MKLKADDILDLLEECEKAREPFLEDAKHSWRLVYEQQRVEPATQMPVSSNHPDNPENHIRAKLLDARSLLLKNYPAFRVQATKPQDMDLSDDISKIAFKRWKDAEAPTVISVSLLEALYAGLSILRHSTINGAGLWVNVPRADFWHDNRVLRVGDSWCCYRTWHRMSYIKKFFSKVKENKKKEEGGISVYQDIGGLETTKSSDKPPESWGKDLKALYEFWAPPSLTDEEEWKIYWMLENKIIDIWDNPFVTKRNVMREDGNNEEVTLGHGRPPFIAHRCYYKQTEDGYLGFYDVEGIAEHLETIQWDLSEASRALVIQARRAALPAFNEEENSLVEPGQVIDWRPSQRILYKSGKTPPMPIVAGLESAQPQLLLETKRRALSEISGIREFMTGEQPRGTSHTPQGTVMYAQEASFIRMPDIVKELDKAIINMGKLMLGYLQQTAVAGEFVDVTIGGEQSWVELQDKHLNTEFNIEVVSGMTTILRDIERQRNATDLYMSVQNVLAMPSIIPAETGQVIPSLEKLAVLRATKQWLQMLDEPSGYGYLPIIDDEIQRIEQVARQQQAPEPTMQGEAV